MMRKVSGIVGKRTDEPEPFERIPEAEFADLPADYGEWDDDGDMPVRHPPVSPKSPKVAGKDDTPALDYEAYFNYLCAVKWKSGAIGQRVLDEEPEPPPGFPKYEPEEKSDAIVYLPARAAGD